MLPSVTQIGGRRELVVTGSVMGTNPQTVETVQAAHQGRATQPGEPSQASESDRARDSDRASQATASPATASPAGQPDRDGRDAQAMGSFSMDLSEDLREMRDWVHEFAANVIRPAGAAWDEREET